MNNVNPIDECNKHFILPNNLTLQLVWCPAGTFQMGSPRTEAERGNDELLHTVTLTRGFWIGRHVVTQEQFKAVMGHCPASFFGRNLPIDSVSRSEALEFCHALTIKIINKQTIPPNTHFSLPTEAQWEYACRAGTQMPFHYGVQLDSRMANFDGSFPYDAPKGLYRQKSCRVGSFPPNAWGIYDMHGNISEWCLDYYKRYDANPVCDPIGENQRQGIVFRGGSWSSRGAACRAAKRSRFMPEGKCYYIGFRIVLNYNV